MLCVWAGLLVCPYVSCLLGPGVTDFDEITVASNLLDSRICHLTTQWKDPFFALLSSLRDINWRPSLLSSCHLPISGTFWNHYSPDIFAGIAEQQGRLQWSGKASWDLMRKFLSFKLQSTSMSNCFFKQAEECCCKLDTLISWKNWNYRMLCTFSGRCFAEWKRQRELDQIMDEFDTILLPQTCFQLGASLFLSARRNALWHCAWALVWARWALAKTLAENLDNDMKTLFSHLVNILSYFIQWFFSDIFRIMFTVKVISPLSVFPLITLAIGVLTSTSSWGVRVRRFCGFVAGGGCHTGSRWRCNLLMCVGVRGLQI